MMIFTKNPLPLRSRDRLTRLASALRFPLSKVSTMSRGYTAFTLAEVLITLGIIGVVAAMTIPTLIADIANKANNTAFLKTYSTLSQAITTIIGENGGAFPGADYAADNIENFASYFATTKIVRSNPNPGVGSLGTTVQLTYGTTTNVIKRPDGTLEDFGGGRTAGDRGNGFVLNDGSFIFVHEFDAQMWKDAFPARWPAHDQLGIEQMEITVDVNGAKPPNEWGKDVFMLAVYERGLAPWGLGYNGATHTTGGAYPYRTCDATPENYLNCAAYIIKDNSYKAPF